MKLATKINLVMLVTFSIGLAASGLYAYQLTTQNAERQVTEQAEILLEQAIALRTYTVNEIRPLTEHANEDYERFHPQSVPAYAATQVANLFKEKRPEYSYKEAVFNPTNVRDNAAPWEEKIINQFIADPSLKRITGSRIIKRKKSLYIAHPIKITNPGCLECHSVPEAAPASMVEKYGTKNGFNWKLGEIIGTQMVLVPYTLPEQMASKTFISFMASTALVFFVLFVLLNVMLRSLVIKPVKQMTNAADNLLKGDVKGSEVTVSGNDEIAELSHSMSKLRTVLAKTVNKLNHRKS